MAYWCCAFVSPLIVMVSQWHPAIVLQGGQLCLYLANTSVLCSWLTTASQRLNCWGQNYLRSWQFHIIVVLQSYRGQYPHDCSDTWIPNYAGIGPHWWRYSLFNFLKLHLEGKLSVILEHAPINPYTNSCSARSPLYWFWYICTLNLPPVSSENSGLGSIHLHCSSICSDLLIYTV